MKTFRILQHAGILGILLLMLSAQTQALPPSTATSYKNTLSAGYGFPSIVRMYLRVTNSRSQYEIMGYGPYMFKYERKINPRWGIGINASYSFSRLSFMADGFDTATKKIRLYEYGIELEEISVLLRGNYHFLQKEKIDAYVGAGVGYGRVTLGTYSLAPVNDFSVFLAIPRPLSFEATVGMRYYPTKRFGLFGEFGLGKSWLLLKRYFIPEAVIQGGVCYRFGT
jgi:opacity protein-like surface antigen